MMLKLEDYAGIFLWVFLLLIGAMVIIFFIFGFCQLFIWFTEAIRGWVG